MVFYRKVCELILSDEGSTDGDITAEESPFYSLFHAHLVKNNTTQHGFALVSIVEAVLGRERKELPPVVDVWLLSDNDSCCQNNFFRVIAPFPSKGVALVLKGVLHSEAQGGKILVDAHFAVAMRELNRFVNDTALNLSTPADLVTALDHRGGAANSTTELGDIYRGNAIMLQWFNAFNAGALATIGCSNQVKYDELKACDLRAKLCEYSGDNGTSWSVRQFSSKRIMSSCFAGYIDPRVENASIEGEDEPSRENENAVDAGQKSTLGIESGMVG